jgi:hypothetical protein
MPKLVLFILTILVIKPCGLRSQTAIKPSQASIPLYEKTPATIINGDTVAIFYLDPVIVASNRAFINIQEAMKYYTLKRDVKVAYPYAIMAEATFRQCQATLETMTSESDKKRYLKQMETIMTDQYKEDLKNMTVNQGRILIKLINRETGTTSYEMVKELKGTLTAFMWQTVARLFGNNLKDTYDPETEDKEIENIIQQIEVGAI